MTLKAPDSEELQSGRAFSRSMGLLAVAAIATAVGLVVVDRPESELGRNGLQTDANQQRPIGTLVPVADAPFAAPSRVMDSTLSRPDPGSDQHG